MPDWKIKIGDEVIVEYVLGPIQGRVKNISPDGMILVSDASGDTRCFDISEVTLSKVRSG